MIAVCWSVTRQVRTHGGAVMHIQGFDYGKPKRTLCGRSLFSGELYDYSVMEFAEFESVLCKRCAATFKRLQPAQS
jgi:hypothetical protein